MRRAQDVVVPIGLDACRAWLDYEGDARRVVAGIKYRNDRRVLARLADGMAGALVPPGGAVVTWVPTTAPRTRRRGFDQAELLARAVARRWSAPCRRLLARGPGPPQTGRDREQRLAGPPLVAARPGRVLTVPVVVVDDVLTTGSTVQAAAEVLRRAGAPWVGALVAARTP